MRRTALLGIAALVLLAGIAGRRTGLQPSALSLELALSPARFGSIIHSWSSEELAQYRATLVLDLGFLATYAAFGHSVATRSNTLQGLVQPVRRFAAWLLPFAAVANLVQDGLLWWLTEVPRFGAPTVYLLAFALAMLKLLAAAMFALLVAFAQARTEA